MKKKGLFFIISLIMLMAIGGNAWGLCIADSDNDEASATPIGYNDSKSGWVCPDTDSWDFYVLEIPEGADVSGNITFNSPQASTVLRIYYYNAADTQVRILDDAFTNETNHEFTVHIAAGNIPSGTYYARVFFWSAAAYDHEYTLTTDLTVTGLSDCVADDNEDPETSAEIAVGSSVNDWVCSADHLDIWHFSVSDDDEDLIQISLNSHPNHLILFVYDEDGEELFQGPTEDGSVSVSLGTLLEEGLDFGVLPRDLVPFDKSPKWGKKYYKKDPGGGSSRFEGIGGRYQAFDFTNEYYIGVFLPFHRDDENSYTLSIRKRYFIDPGMFEIYERAPFDPIGPIVETPWGSRFGGRYNAGRSFFNGPPGPMFSSLRVDQGLSLNDIRQDHQFYEGLLIGPNSIAYMLEKPNKLLHIIDISDGSTWGTRQTNSHKPPCLDSAGNLYFIHEDGRSMDSIGGFAGRVRIPNDGQQAVEMVGQNIYVSTFVRLENSSYVHRISLNGDILWTNGPLDGRVAGVAEDAAGKVYIQTARALYKFGTDGVAEWDQAFRGVVNLQGSPFAPLIGSDGRIGCYMVGNHGFRVYNPDGSIYKVSGNPQPLRAVCFGSNGLFYVATRTKVACYDNWTDPVWEQHISPEVNAMIMGMDDTLYVTQIGRYQTHPGFPVEYESFLITLNPNNGSTINRHNINLRNETIDIIAYETTPFGFADLAIGEGGKIISLHFSGQLEVFSPQLVAIFGVYEALGGG